MIAVSIVILAGGLGTRMGGDKGLKLLCGRALVDWVSDVISKQSGEVLINANTNTNEYAKRGYRVIADQIPEWPGPLAGLQAALCHARHEWVATVPCDTPFLPDDLIARLRAAITSTAEAAVAVVEGQRQPAIALYRKDVLPKLDNFLAAGGRKVNAWLDSLHLVEVPFDNPAAFININSSQELIIANQILQAKGKYSDVEYAIA